MRVQDETRITDVTCLYPYKITTWNTTVWRANKREWLKENTKKLNGPTFGVQTSHNLGLPLLSYTGFSRTTNTKSCVHRMDSVCFNSLHTPCIQTNDLLQDTDDDPQANQSTYNNLTNYPSATDEMEAFSRTLREKMKATTRARVSYPHLSNA